MAKNSLIDWLVFNATSAVFQPYRGETSLLTCLLHLIIFSFSYIFNYPESIIHVKCNIYFLSSIRTHRNCFHYNTMYVCLRQICAFCPHTSIAYILNNCLIVFHKIQIKNKSFFKNLESNPFSLMCSCCYLKTIIVFFYYANFPNFYLIIKYLKPNHSKPVTSFLKLFWTLGILVTLDFNAL